MALGSNLFLQHVSSQGNENYGLGDSEWFSIFRMFELADFTFSAKSLLGLPSPGSNTSTPVIGREHLDVSGGLLVGYPFTLLGRDHFIELESAYRKRFGPSRDQWIGQLTAGLQVADSWQFLPQLSITKRAASDFNTGFTQSSSDDYDLLKGQLSTIYHFSGQRAVQVGGFTHIEGKNAGGGNGMFIALWHRF